MMIDVQSEEFIHQLMTVGVDFAAMTQQKISKINSSISQKKHQKAQQHI
jgi:hypothetical protein